MAASPAKAQMAENSGGQPMGANSTQAVGIVFMLLGFILLAGAFAEGGILLALSALVLLGVAAFFFKKCKSWEEQNE
jgi:hypothetical protein